jgi:predicted enzyme related to lactoylglutathione lyase
MTANLAHFAINSDDPSATRAFYEKVFGWRFEAWGPPGFYRITTGTDAEPGIGGALQERRDLVGGTPTIGLECTFAVDDVEAVAATVRAAGGEILMERFTISGVGHLIFFRDPGGSAVGAMQFDESA